MPKANTQTSQPPANTAPAPQANTAPMRRDSSGRVIERIPQDESYVSLEHKIRNIFVESVVVTYSGADGNHIRVRIIFDVSWIT